MAPTTLQQLTDYSDSGEVQIAQKHDHQGRCVVSVTVMEQDFVTEHPDLATALALLLIKVEDFVGRTGQDWKEAGLCLT